MNKIRNDINCPFLVRFSCPGVKDKSLPVIFRRVKITHCNPKHSCGLSIHAYKNVSKSSKSKNKLNYKAI